MTTFYKSILIYNANNLLHIIEKDFWVYKPLGIIDEMGY